MKHSDNIVRSYSLEQFQSYSNSGLIERVVHMFIKTTNEYFESVKLALQENNIVRVNELAHSIKPSIDMLCIKSITQIVRKIEQATLIDNELLSLINYFNQELQNVIDQMLVDYK